jgi:hypothetical protein
MKEANVASFIVVHQISSCGLKKTKAWILCGTTEVGIMCHVGHFP